MYDLCFIVCACLQPVNARPSSETHISVTYLVIGSFPFCKGNSPISGD